MLTGTLPVGRFQMPSRKAALDVRIDEIVLRALEHEPAQRYQQAQEAKSELQGLEASTASPAASSPAVDAHRASAPSVESPLTSVAGGVSLRSVALPYACLWVVGYLALRLDVSEPLQGLLARVFVAAAAPYLAWRWWTGRGQRRGLALSYGLGAVLSAVFATLAAPGAPEKLLSRLLTDESFDPSVDPLFVRIVAIAVASVSIVVALRARRRIGVLSWKRFTNFAFDLLIVLSALGAVLVTVLWFVEHDRDRGTLLLAMPLFFIAFACDVGERRLQPLERAVDSPQRGASPARIDPAG